MKPWPDVAVRIGRLIKVKHTNHHYGLGPMEGKKLKGIHVDRYNSNDDGYYRRIIGRWYWQTKRAKREGE